MLTTMVVMNRTTMRDPHGLTNYILPGLLYLKLRKKTAPDGFASPIFGQALSTVCNLMLSSFLVGTVGGHLFNLQY